MEKKEKTNKKSKKPWPTKKAMQQVYDQNLWGTHESGFYSGDGSHDSKILQPYLTKVISFLSSFENPLRVCDLGCGDFNVGRQLAPHAVAYLAVDIVGTLIAYLKSKFREDYLTFYCLDISRDELPTGDCAIIRQVFQHLSNGEILRILPKLAAYKYVILTEHLPQGAFIPNIDIISGQTTRLKKGSGVDLLSAPFNFKALDAQELLAIPLQNNKGVIKTTLFKLQ